MYGTAMHVLVGCFITCYASVLPDTQNPIHQFQALVDSLPRNALSDIVEAQRTLFDIYDIHRTYEISTVDSSSQRNESFQIAKSNHPTLIADVHVNIYFIGFPSQSLEILRGKWFKSLSVDDPFLANIDSIGEVISVPGGGNNRFRFNLVQNSFLVGEAITLHFQKLLRPLNEASMSSPHFYLNANEVEATLLDYVDFIHSNAMQSSRRVNVNPISLFVLHLNILHPLNKTEPIKYSYKNGFSKRDLELLANDGELLRKCKNIITSEIGKKSRITFEADKKNHPLLSYNQSPRVKGRRLSVVDLEGDTIAQAYDQDLVDYSRTWAKSFQKEMDEQVIVYLSL